MRTFCIVQILIFVRLFAIAQVKMSDYMPQNGILQIAGIYPHQNGFYTIDEYDTYDKKHKLTSASYVEKNGISDYDKDLNLNFRIIFPKKINGTIAYYNNCLHVDGTYYLFVETLEKEGGEKVVNLYGLTYNPKSEEWSQPKWMVSRPGGWLARRNSSFNVLYNAAIKKFRLLSDIYRYPDPNLITFHEFDTQLKETDKKETEGPVPNSFLSKHYLTDDYDYFFYKEYSKDGISIVIGETAKKQHSYWLVVRNIRNGKTTRFPFDPGLYDLEGGQFTSRGGKTIFYADVISTEESKKEYKEKHNKIGWLVADLSNMEKPATTLIKSTDFFGQPKEKRAPAILATFRYYFDQSQEIRWTHLLPATDGYFILIENETKIYSQSDRGSYISYFSYDNIVVIKTDINFNIVNEEVIYKSQVRSPKFRNEVSHCLVWDDSEQLRLYYNDNEKNLKLPEDEEKLKVFSVHQLDNGVFREVIIKEDGSLGPDRELLSINEKEALVPWTKSVYGHFDGKLYFMAKQHGKNHPEAGKIKILEIKK